MKTTEKSPMLVTVDMQNDFVDQNGSLRVLGAEEIIDPLNRFAEIVRGVGGLAVFTRDWHPAVTPHFADYGGIWPTHCVAETWGADFAEGLEIEASDVIINKGTGQTDGYSGWEGASDDGDTLEKMMARRKIFLGGVATDYCVKATAIDIAKRQRESEASVYLLRDAVRAVNREDEEAALTDICAAGVQIVSTGEALKMIQGGTK